MVLFIEYDCLRVVDVAKVDQSTFLIVSTKYSVETATVAAYEAHCREMKRKPYKDMRDTARKGRNERPWDCEVRQTITIMAAECDDLSQIYSQSIDSEREIDQLSRHLTTEIDSLTEELTAIEGTTAHLVELRLYRDSDYAGQPRFLLVLHLTRKSDFQRGLLHQYTLMCGWAEPIKVCLGDDFTLMPLSRLEGSGGVGWRLLGEGTGDIAEGLWVTENQLMEMKQVDIGIDVEEYQRIQALLTNSNTPDEMRAIRRSHNGIDLSKYYQSLGRQAEI